jgi:GT2 family glycosyltransferase
MKVALCTPSGKGYLHHKHLFSVAETFSLAPRNGIELRHHVICGNSILPFVRNHLVGKSLSENCDYIVFVDDDIAWEAKDFFKLIAWDEGIVAAAPAKRHKRWDELPNCAFRTPPDGKLLQRKNPFGRVWKVEGLATAFMAIKASVFKEIEHLTQRYFTDGDDGSYQVRDWFWLDLVNVDGKLMGQGEDYNFCDKWKKVGGELFLDPDIRLRHYDGNVCFDSCPADFELKLDEAVNA